MRRSASYIKNADCSNRSALAERHAALLKSSPYVLGFKVLLSSLVRDDCHALRASSRTGLPLKRSETDGFTYLGLDHVQSNAVYSTPEQGKAEPEAWLP